VILTRAPDTMLPTRYDLHAMDGGFEERALAAGEFARARRDGSVEYILHSVDDATMAASRKPCASWTASAKGSSRWIDNGGSATSTPRRTASWNARRATCAARCSGKRTPAWKAPNSSGDTGAR
jgi:hypothetical protein